MSEETIRALAFFALGAGIGTVVGLVEGRVFFLVYHRCDSEQCGQSTRSDSHLRSRHTNPFKAVWALWKVRRQYPKSRYYIAVARRVPRR